MRTQPKTVIYAPGAIECTTFMKTGIAPMEGTGVSAEAKDALKRDKSGRTAPSACRFVPLSHESYGRAAPSQRLRFYMSLQSSRP